MAKAPKTAIQPTREEDYPEWYQQVIKAADLAEISPVRGCMVIKPWGYAIWENMQAALDRMFKETGHENAYFPLFIPMSFLEKEAKHVEGFAKECAVVTHHRLEPSPDGGLRPAGPLDEPLIVRPTSETIIGAMYAKWVQSYRDLPIRINQWANVVRWELRTRMFLRTAEFLWQEGHTAHATPEEAWEETRLMLDVYSRFARDYLAIPVIQGEKTAGERFPGAVSTLCIEAMMQDRKALQAGTSHFLGQNFSRAQEIKFQNAEGQEDFAWTTSWGVSTRLVGAMIMSHADDDGLVVPPRLAPKHAVILPIYRSEDDRTPVLEYCRRLEREIAAQRHGEAPVRVFIDDRDLRGGEKNWQHVKKGVPLRIEVGPRDVASDHLFVARRDRPEKQSEPRSAFVATIGERLDEIQNGLLRRAAAMRDAHTRSIESVDAFREFFTPRNAERPEIHGGFALAHWVESPETDALLADLKVTVRCLPSNPELAGGPGACVFTGREATQRAVFAKAY
ncbi:MAG: proline--tRNA ligase [Planctomycetes bacterium]|nr:proline--tRNA ligase [Planctomycetota bacterium]